MAGRPKGTKNNQLTPRQREVVGKVISGMTPTRAVMSSSQIKKPTQAGAYWATMKKSPKVQMALMEHSKLAEQTIINSILDYNSSDTQWQRTLAVETSKWVHDKVHGKAIQQSQNINYNFTQHAAKKSDEYGL